jgi:hypothetical protein
VLGSWVNGPVLKIVSGTVVVIVGSMALLLVVLTLVPGLK